MRSGGLPGIYLALKGMNITTDWEAQCTRLESEVGCVRCKDLETACSFEQMPSNKASKPRVLNRIKCDFCRSSKQKVRSHTFQCVWAKGEHYSVFLPIDTGVISTALSASDVLQKICRVRSLLRPLIFGNQRYSIYLI
jgi:hypothetical protein